MERKSVARSDYLSKSLEEVRDATPSDVIVQLGIGKRVIDALSVKGHISAGVAHARCRFSVKPSDPNLGAPAGLELTVSYTTSSKSTNGGRDLNELSWVIDADPKSWRPDDEVTQLSDYKALEALAHGAVPSDVLRRFSP